MTKLKIKPYTSLDELDTIRDAWNLLRKTSKNAMSFTLFEWFETACKISNYDPFVITGWDNDRLVSILPVGFRQTNEGKIYELPNNKLIESADMIALPDYHDSLGSMFSLLIAKATKNDLISLRGLRKNSLVVTGFQDYMNREEPNNLEVKLTMPFVIPLVDIPDGWDSYLSDKGNRFRQKTNNYVRKLEKENIQKFPFEETQFSASYLIDYLIKNIIERFGTRSLFYEDLSQRFVREMYLKLMSLEQIKVDVFFMNREFLGCSFYVLDHFQKKVISIHFAFEASGKSIGISRVMFLSLIQKASDLCYQCVDLGAGQNELKRQLHTRVEPFLFLNIKKH